MNPNEFMVEDDDDIQFVEVTDGDDTRTTANNQKILRNRKKLGPISNRLMDSNSKFLEDFDPEKSTREQRKLSVKTKVSVPPRFSMYDARGIHRETGFDLCDCLDTSCPGCHFECPSCNSCKCGPICRSKRKYMFNMIEIDGKDDTVKGDKDKAEKEKR